MQTSGALNGTVHVPQTSPIPEILPYKIKQSPAVFLSSAPLGLIVKTIPLLSVTQSNPLPSVNIPTLFFLSDPIPISYTSTQSYSPLSINPSDFSILSEEPEDERIMYIADHIKNHEFDIL
jgi:hypothetical protein